MYTVKIDEQAHGEVFKVSSRWRWLRPSSKGIETYHRGATLMTIRAHIARLNRRMVGDVRLVRQ